VNRGTCAHDRVAARQRNGRELNLQGAVDSQSNAVPIAPLRTVRNERKHRGLLTCFGLGRDGLGRLARLAETSSVLGSDTELVLLALLQSASCTSEHTDRPITRKHDACDEQFQN